MIKKKLIQKTNFINAVSLCTMVQRKIPAQEFATTQFVRSWEDLLTKEMNNPRAESLLPVNDFELCETTVELDLGKPKKNSYAESLNVLLKFWFSYFHSNFIIS